MTSCVSWEDSSTKFLSWQCNSDTHVFNWKQRKGHKEDLLFTNKRQRGSTGDNICYGQTMKEAFWFGFETMCSFKWRSATLEMLARTNSFKKRHHNKDLYQVILMLWVYIPLFSHLLHSVCLFHVLSKNPAGNFRARLLIKDKSVHALYCTKSLFFAQTIEEDWILQHWESARNRYYEEKPRK